MSSPFANPLGGGWNWPSWLVRTSAQQPPATATVSAAALSGYDDNDNDEPVAPAAAIKRLGASSPCSPQQQHPSKRLKSDRTEGGRPLEASVLASVLTSATATATATASSPQIKLEQVLEAVQEHTEKAQERQARAEERERLANARAERIESLLERVLEKLVDAPERAATNRRRRCSTDRDGGDEEQENNDDDDDDDEEEEEFDDEEEEESADEASVVEGTNEAAAAAASPRTPTITPRKGQLWTPNEREIVVRGVAIYGKDYKVVSDLLENRNYDQTRGFFRRNDDYIDREISKYPCNNESDKKKLLEDIRRLQQNGEDRVEKNDDDGATLRTGIWSQREYELAAKGLAIHGLNNFDAIATLVRTRTPKQTHRFLMRRYDELREMAKAD
eukprot:jgi/Psemu1/23174/gm1.23174_g